MAETLREFVDKFLMISKSDPTPVDPIRSMSLPWLMWKHALSLLNRQWHNSWLPKPRLYVFEADAEMSFQKQQLSSKFSEALGKINASFPTIQSSQTQLLKETISAVAISLQKLQRMAKASDSSRWPWSAKSNETLALDRESELLAQTHRYLMTGFQTFKLYEISLAKLLEVLQPLWTISCSHCQSKISPMGSLRVTESLLVQVPNMSFVSLTQSSTFNKNSNVSNITGTQLKPPILAYDLNAIDDNQLLAGRSVIAELCMVGNITHNPNDNLYTICTIHTLLSIMSGLNTDALSDQRRSWMVELKTVDYEFGVGAVYQVLEGLASQAKGGY